MLLLYRYKNINRSTVIIKVVSAGDMCVCVCVCVCVRKDCVCL